VHCLKQFLHRVKILGFELFSAVQILELFFPVPGMTRTPKSRQSSISCLCLAKLSLEFELSENTSGSIVNGTII